MKGIKIIIQLAFISIIIFIVSNLTEAKSELQKTISEQKSYILGLEQIIKKPARINKNHYKCHHFNDLDCKKCEVEWHRMGIIINRAIIEKSRDKCCCKVN